MIAPENQLPCGNCGAADHTARGCAGLTIQALINATVRLAHDLESTQHHASRTPHSLIGQMPSRLEYTARRLEELAAEAKALAEQAREIERQTA